MGQQYLGLKLKFNRIAPLLIFLLTAGLLFMFPSQRVSASATHYWYVEGGTIDWPTGDYKVGDTVIISGTRAKMACTNSDYIKAAYVISKDGGIGEIEWGAFEYNDAANTWRVSGVVRTTGIYDGTYRVKIRITSRYLLQLIKDGEPIPEWLDDVRESVYTHDISLLAEPILVAAGHYQTVNFEQKEVVLSAPDEVVSPVLTEAEKTRLRNFSIPGSEDYGKYKLELDINNNTVVNDTKVRLIFNSEAVEGVEIKMEGAELFKQDGSELTHLSTIDLTDTQKDINKYEFLLGPWIREKGSGKYIIKYRVKFDIQPAVSITLTTIKTQASLRFQLGNGTEKVEDQNTANKKLYIDTLVNRVKIKTI